MIPFLNCNIWSILSNPFNDFYLVESIYPHNSLTDKINKTHNPGCFQIPEFEIKNLDLLHQIDPHIVNANNIPVIRRDENDEWEINLLHYNQYVKNTSVQ